MSARATSSLTLEHALLGFLQQRPMHAYEMFQLLSRGKPLGQVWHLKQSHLYALLARLERVGYVATTTEAQGIRPPRKVMSLTAGGRSAFQRWLVTPVAHGRDFRIEFLAKLFFARQSGAEAVAALVDVQRRACQGWLLTLRAQLTSIGAECSYDRLVLQFRISQITAILGWLDTCTNTLGSTTLT